MEAVASPPTTFRLTPRPYQYEAVAALLAAAARGVQRPLLVLPTGTGKTIVFAFLIQRRRPRTRPPWPARPLPEARAAPGTGAGQQPRAVGGVCSGDMFMVSTP